MKEFIIRRVSRMRFPLCLSLMLKHPLYLTVHHVFIVVLITKVVLYLEIQSYTAVESTFLHALVEMLFCRKRSEQNHPPLFFNDVLVASASDHKQLGIILDCKLLLTKHISEKVAKARKGIGIIRHLSFHVPLDILDQLYKLFARPLLDYCDIIYHVPANTNPFNYSISLKYSMQSIESTQYQAALAVSGAWKGSNTSKLYEELGWKSLTDRRWYRRLLQFYKIINDLAPSYLKDIIPPLRRSLYGHPRHVFNEFRCHSFTFMHSFFFRIVSNPGTILAVNLRRYHLSPNSKKLY